MDNQTKAELIQEIWDHAGQITEAPAKKHLLGHACKLFLGGNEEQYDKVIESLEELPDSVIAKEYLAKLSQISKSKDKRDETCIDKSVKETNSALEYHELADLFPMLCPKDFEILKNDIAENGQREAIWLYQGKIIDGRNRYKACLALNKEPEFKEWDGKNCSALEFVISLNIHRRHFSSSQLAAYAVDFLPRLEAEAEERQQARLKQNTVTEKIPEREMGESRKFAAELFPGTNERYISDAKRIKEKLPDEFERVKKGERKIPHVIRDLKIEQDSSEGTRSKVSVYDALKSVLAWIAPEYLEELEALVVLAGKSKAAELMQKRVEELRSEKGISMNRPFPGTMTKAG